MDSPTFNLHNPNRDDLEETLQYLIAMGKSQPKRSVYVSIGAVGDREIGLYADHLNSITNSVHRAMEACGDKNSMDTCTFSINKSKHYLEGSPLDNGEDYLAGWVTEFFITLKYIPYGS